MADVVVGEVIDGDEDGEALSRKPREVTFLGKTVRVIPPHDGMLLALTKASLPETPARRQLATLARFVENLLADDESREIVEVAIMDRDAKGAVSALMDLVTASVSSGQSRETRRATARRATTQRKAVAAKSRRK